MTDTLSRRRCIAGLATLSVVGLAGVSPAPAVPPDLEALGANYANAVDVAAGLDVTAKAQIEEGHEERLIACMRAHGVKAFASNGRLFVDAWTLASCTAGGACVKVSDVRGL